MARLAVCCPRPIAHRQLARDLVAVGIFSLDVPVLRDILLELFIMECQVIVYGPLLARRYVDAASATEQRSHRSSHASPYGLHAAVDNLMVRQLVGALDLRDGALGVVPPGVYVLV